jgi:hypothetical protein
MQCTNFYGTNSLNPCFVPSNFSGLSKNAPHQKNNMENGFLEMVYHHGFERAELWWDLDNNPQLLRKMQN